MIPVRHPFLRPLPFAPTRRGVLLALAGAFAAGGRARAQATGSLVGRLLVASDDMPDPRFAESVVLVFRHRADFGAMGVIINRPMAELPTEEVLAELQLPSELQPGAPATLVAHYGGPVERTFGFVFHSVDWKEPRTEWIAPDIGFSDARTTLGALGAGTGPHRWLLAAGYSGWSPGQLEREMQERSWTAVPATAALVFEGDPESKWETVRRRSVDL